MNLEMQLLKPAGQYMQLKKSALIRTKSYQLNDVGFTISFDRGHNEDQWFCSSATKDQQYKGKRWGDKQYV